MMPAAIRFAAMTLVLGADCDHRDLLMQDAADAGVKVTEFALH